VADVSVSSSAAAFEKLDADGSGVVDVADLRGVYDASMHPDVVSGKKTEDEILQNMVDGFERRSKDKDGRVTLEEFKAYYGGVSAYVEDDDMFKFMVKRAWNL